MISFIMPAKNAGEYISEAIEAIRQCDAEWELIVVEDHSDDDTFEIASAIGERDRRIQVAKNLGRGKIAGLNFGYSLTRGDTIKCIDADDILHPDYFKFELQNESDAMCHDAYITGSRMEYMCDYIVSKKILNSSIEQCITELVSLPRWSWSFRRKIAKNIFPMPEELPFEDVWFSLLVKRFSDHIHYVPNKLYYYRQHRRQTYSGILNFEKKAVIFRAKRVLRFLEVLEENSGRLSLEGWKENDFLEIPREYYSLLGKERLALGNILGASLPTGLTMRVLVSRKLSLLAPMLLKMKWNLQARMK